MVIAQDESGGREVLILVEDGVVDTWLVLFVLRLLAIDEGRLGAE